MVFKGHPRSLESLCIREKQDGGFIPDCIVIKALRQVRINIFHTYVSILKSTPIAGMIYVSEPKVPN